MTKIEILSMGDRFDIIKNMVAELSDSVDFMNGFNNMIDSIGCTCEAEDHDSKDCVCVDPETGEIKRITDKETVIVHGQILLAQMSEEYRVAYREGLEDKFDDSYRVCDDCGAIMTSGYVVDGGMAYHCSDECLHLHFTPEEWEEEYDDGESQSYWTDWRQTSYPYLEQYMAVGENGELLVGTGNKLMVSVGDIKS